MIRQISCFYEQRLKYKKHLYYKRIMLLLSVQFVVVYEISSYNVARKNKLTKQKNKST